MIFHETTLKDAMLIDLEKRGDDRGFFARTYCQREFSAHVLDINYTQQNTSSSKYKGTLRGMHYQADPHAEDKLVRCVRGAIFDAIVDLRPSSPTYCGWFGVELDASSRRALYVPKGFAHGFQTLSDEAEVLYQMSTPYVGGAGRGVRWDDPVFGISWPEAALRTMSERDRTYPDFVP